MLPPMRTHAVVLGGSIAGLLAARVLADAYRQVTIVERDPLPAGIEARRGVPQGDHVHALLTRGVLVLEELLPGFRDDLVAQGAIAGDLLGNVRWYVQRRMLKQVTAGLPALSASRPLIEGTIRRRVLALPNITVEDRTDVAGIVTTVDGRRVTGARIRRPGRDSDEVIAA